ncbi:TPM domain-containing protein [Capnocytophaga sp. ARDL2]|uniref:TPM domain-containing protein n=1 Tax=Capnocytophaga sp. ARDL2 TaxID=3238809 RepID=UPI003557DF04
MPHTNNFLTHEEEQQVVQAIIQAEKNTTGEIRVHIENHSNSKLMERAWEVFHLLEMQKTNARNGVLFYVGTIDHRFAIVGDEGINRVVPDDFWECTKDVVISNFKNKNYCQGLVEGVLRAGEQLKKYFPADESTSIDELSNEISKGVLGVSS